MSKVIEGVLVKDITTHGDQRGFFREMLRIDEDFSLDHVGQLSHSLVNSDILKAWHYHNKQSQWNYVASGEVVVALYDNRKDSLTFGVSMEFRFGENYQPKAYFFSGQQVRQSLGGSGNGSFLRARPRGTSSTFSFS